MCRRRRLSKGRLSRCLGRSWYELVVVAREYRMAAREALHDFQGSGLRMIEIGLRTFLIVNMSIDGRAEQGIGRPYVPHDYIAILYQLRHHMHRLLTVLPETGAVIQIH